MPRMPADARGCSGMLGDARGCPGCLVDANRSRWFPSCGASARLLVGWIRAVNPLVFLISLPPLFIYVNLCKFIIFCCWLARHDWPTWMASTWFGILYLGLLSNNLNSLKRFMGRRFNIGLIQGSGGGRGWWLVGGWTHSDGASCWGFVGYSLRRVCKWSTSMNESTIELPGRMICALIARWSGGAQRRPGEPRGGGWQEKEKEKEEEEGIEGQVGGAGLWWDNAGIVRFILSNQIWWNCLGGGGGGLKCCHLADSFHGWLIWIADWCATHWQVDSMILSDMTPLVICIWFAYDLHKISTPVSAPVGSLRVLWAVDGGRWLRPCWSVWIRHLICIRWCPWRDRPAIGPPVTSMDA